MKRRLFLFLTILTAILIFSACGNQESIAGRWQSEHTFLEFFANGEGLETRAGREFAFTWSEENHLLTFAFINNAENSFINDLMSLVIHGSPTDSFRFSLSNGELAIADNHGHGHFEFIFLRAE